MTIAEILQKMINLSQGNHHDINHLLKVYAYAKTIGELEQLDSETQFVLEIAAIIHDIACPLCREKYGRASGKYQELESEPLVREFLQGMGLSSEQVERIVYLVCHHHTLEPVDGMDYRILLEADYLVNADESGHSEEQIATARRVVFKTQAGLALLDSMYGCGGCCQ